MCRWYQSIRKKIRSNVETLGVVFQKPSSATLGFVDRWKSESDRDLLYLQYSALWMTTLILENVKQKNAEIKKKKNFVSPTKPNEITSSLWFGLTSLRAAAVPAAATAASTWDHQCLLHCRNTPEFPHRNWYKKIHGFYNSNLFIYKGNPW